MTAAGFDAAKLATAYRRLVMWCGAQLAILLLGGLAIVLAGPGKLAFALALIRLWMLLVTVVALVLYAYRTADALGSGAAPVWAAAMLVPLINLITLLVLSSKATRACREAGIDVGFLGPKNLPQR